MLERLAKRCDPTFFRLFTHIDARSPIGPKDMARLSALGCHVFKKYRIRWGSITHLYAILDLLQMATQEADCDYVHIISGQDYPVASVDDFQARCDGHIFMNYEALQDCPDYVKDRYRRFNLFYRLQSGPPFSGSIHKHLDRLSLWGQRRLGIHRQQITPFQTLFQGIVWMSFPAAAGRKLLADPVAQTFLKSIRTTYLPEETFFQSYFLNSELAARVLNSDLRYADWTHRNGSVPAYLEESDVEPIWARRPLFARKVSTDVSQAFMRRIDEILGGERPSGK